MKETNKPLPSIPSSRAAGMLCVAVISLLCLAGQAGAQTIGYAFTNLFTIPGSTLGTGTTNRGMAYDSVSNLLYISSQTPSIVVFDGSAGAFQGTISMSGVSGGTTFSLDQVGVAGDGAIYGVNLCTTSASNNKLYRWANWEATATVSFNANALANGGALTSGRIGDTMAVTGSGTNTLILCGVGAQHYFVLFSTTDGLNFTATVINVSSGLTVPGNVFGFCFYTNNTFLVKPATTGNDTVYLVQYPTNFASQTLVTGTVLATTTALGTQFNNTTMLAYSPSNGFLCGFQTGNNPSSSELLTGSFGTLSSQATTSGATPTSNGNATGGAAIGGSGSTNLYAYDTANSLFAYKILTIPPVGPSVGAPTGGITNGYAPETLSVTASGSPPLAYQWYSISGNSTNLIAGATTNTLTVNTPVTNLYYVVVSNSVNAVTSSVVGLSLLTPVTNSVVTTLWNAGVGAYANFLQNDNATRGIAYDTNTGAVAVSTQTAVYVVNGNTGAYLGELNPTNEVTSQFACDQVGIADDGIVYAANLALAGNTSFNLYAWPSATNFSATLTHAFAGDPGNDSNAERWGDTMAVRGAGANTQVLLGSKSTKVSLLTVQNLGSTNFQAIAIAVSGVPSGFAANGVAFGAGNTFWAKSYLGDLYEISFDPVGQTGSVVLDYTAGAQYPSALSGVAVDMTNNILAGVDIGDTHNDLRLYQLTGTANPPVLFEQSFFPSFNVNGNDNAAIVMKYPRVYALDANNGIVALTYGVPATTPVTISSPPSSLTVYSTDPNAVMTVQAAGSLPLYYQWQYSSSSNGPYANISGATNNSYSIAYPTANQAGYYQVIVHNIANAVTSTPPALLTVTFPITSTQVTNLWNIPGGQTGSESFLDNSGYDTRGLAFDTNTMQIAVADHYNIHLFGTNGTYTGDLNTAGVPNGGFNGWLFDQVGVSDDGVLFGANLALSGPGFSITSWAAGFGPGSVGSAYAYDGAGNTDPGNGSGDRWGDTMAVRGSTLDDSCEILLGSYTGTNVLLFTTSDGSDFNPMLIAVTNVPAGFAGQGIAFGAGNTFWAASPGYNLRQIAFDTNTLTGGAILTYIAGTQVPSAFDGIAVDVSAGVLSGVDFNNVPHDVQLYTLSGNTNGPALIDQVFFGSVNPNSQLNAVTTLKGGLGFGLDVNNGLVAFSYGALPGGAATILSVSYSPGNTTVNIGNLFANHTYQLQSTASLDAPISWSNVGAPINTSNPTASVVDTSPAGTAKFYRVINN